MDGIEFSKDPTLEIVSFLNGFISEIEFYTDFFKDTQFKVEDKEYMEIFHSLLKDIITTGSENNSRMTIVEVDKRSGGSIWDDKYQLDRFSKKVWRQWFSNFDSEVVTEDIYLQSLLPNEDIYDDKNEIFSLFPIFSFNNEYCVLLIQSLEKRLKDFTQVYDQLKDLYSEIGSNVKGTVSQKKDKEWYDRTNSPTRLSVEHRSPYNISIYTEEKSMKIRNASNLDPDQDKTYTREKRIEVSSKEYIRFEDISSIHNPSPHEQGIRNTIPVYHVNNEINTEEDFCSDSVDLSLRKRMEESDGMGILSGRNAARDEGRGLIEYIYNNNDNIMTSRSIGSERDNRYVSGEAIEELDRETPRLFSNVGDEAGHDAGHEDGIDYNFGKPTSTQRHQYSGKFNEFTFKDSSQRKDKVTGEVEDMDIGQRKKIEPNFIIHTNSFIADESPKEDKIEKKSDSYVNLSYFIRRFIDRRFLNKGYECVSRVSASFKHSDIISTYFKEGKRTTKFDNLMRQSDIFISHYSAMKLKKSILKIWVRIVNDAKYSTHRSPPKPEPLYPKNNINSVWEWESGGGKEKISGHKSNRDLVENIGQISDKKFDQSSNKQSAKSGRLDIRTSSRKNLIQSTSEVLRSKPTPMNSNSVFGKLGTMSIQNESESNIGLSNIVTREIDFTKPHISEFKYSSNPASKPVQMKWESLLKSKLNKEEDDRIVDSSLNTRSNNKPTNQWAERAQKDVSNVNSNMKTILDMTNPSRNIEQEQTKKIMLKIILKRASNKYNRASRKYWQILIDHASHYKTISVDENNVEYTRSLQTIQEDKYESFENFERPDLLYPKLIQPFADDKNQYNRLAYYDVDNSSKNDDMKRTISEKEEPSVTFGNRYLETSKRKTDENYFLERSNSNGKHNTSRSGSNNKYQNMSDNNMREINDRMKKSILHSVSKFSNEKTPTKQPAPIIYTFDRMTKPTQVIAPTINKSNEKRRSVSNNRSSSVSKLHKKPFVVGKPSKKDIKTRSPSPVYSREYVNRLMRDNHLESNERDISNNKKMNKNGPISRENSNSRKSKYRSIFDGRPITHEHQHNSNINISIKPSISYSNAIDYSKKTIQYEDMYLNHQKPKETGVSRLHPSPLSKKRKSKTPSRAVKPQPNAHPSNQDREKENKKPAKLSAFNK